ncbi:uncharacterized protein LOC119720335 [Patiria miniata]|uniref:Chromo domain-containing protein n=1 Tax=Patiria miniata TaxID=46514 RepID=A0A913Z2H2_PATMI|nr:uncharacterized protein LOC119720332 [Patiria miniata]XP_038045903.1 uncharacterized protein LOC119720333 [Patiria miniata]XP_038045904.1 uncharacterized protein LOC119720334 [Patiria miniata]XP_038045905.1 uncharacterized protein LOC119720335 [Patiria miniata]
MYKYFTASNTHTYLETLPKLMSAYNRAYHRSIGTSPASVNSENAEEIWRNLYSVDGHAVKPITFRFNVEDTVRISMTTRPFRKGYLPGWTTELFTVSARIPRHPPVYRLKDYNGDEVDGTFYQHELQRVVQLSDLYQVEKVLRTRTHRRKREYFVKWLGYQDKFNSWTTSLRRL